MRQGPFISKKTKLHNSAFRVYVIDEIPRNDYGKVRFTELKKIEEKGFNERDRDAQKGNGLSEDEI